MELDCATELRLGPPGSSSSGRSCCTTSTPAKRPPPPPAYCAGAKRALDEASPTTTAGHDEVDDDQDATTTTAAPAAKAQVVGWPPVRACRRNTFQAAAAAKKSEQHQGGGGGLYVKVSMDGAPYLRKVDLKMYKGYMELREALDVLFSAKCFPAGAAAAADQLAIAYEDKDGDLMLVGDVPWDMFISSCKKLRIMKGSEAR